MHPDCKQVVPVMAEPIRNTDGSKKQDCELNAAKRLIPQLRKQFPKMGLIITGDDLGPRWKGSGSSNRKLGDRS